MSILQEMYRKLPEVGDRINLLKWYSFSMKHICFSLMDSPKILLKTIERVIRLIRSKGVRCLFYNTISCDIPDSILAQLGNRIQHALEPTRQKSFTPLK